MIFDVTEADFIRQEGPVYFIESETEFVLYKVPKEGGILFRMRKQKSTPEDTIMFMERALISATRLLGLEKDVTFSVSMS